MNSPMEVYLMNKMFFEQNRGLMMALIASMVLFLVTGCGGGGGSDPAPTPPVATNGAPDAKASAPETAMEGETVILDATASTDPDGDSLTYTWSCTGVTVTGVSEVKASYEAPTDVSSTRVIQCSVAVSDGTATASDSVSTTVQDMGDYDRNVLTLKTAGGASNRTDDVADQANTLAGEHYVYSSQCWIDGLAEPVSCDGYFTADTAGDPVDVHEDLRYGVIVNDGSQGSCLENTTYGNGAARTDPDQCMIILTQDRIKFVVVWDGNAIEFAHITTSNGLATVDIESYAPVGSCSEGSSRPYSNFSLLCNDNDLTHTFDDGTVVEHCVETILVNASGVSKERHIMCPGHEMLVEDIE